MPEENKNTSNVNDSKEESAQKSGVDTAQPQNKEQTEVKQAVKPDPTPPVFNFDGQQYTPIQLYNMQKMNQARADQTSVVNKKLEEELTALRKQVEKIANRPIDDGVAPDPYANPSTPEYQKYLRMEEERQAKLISSVLDEKLKVIDQKIEQQQQSAEEMLIAQEQAAIMNKVNKEYVDYMNSMQQKGVPVPRDIHDLAFNETLAVVGDITKRPAYFKFKVESMMRERGLLNEGIEALAKAEKKTAEMLAQTQVAEGSGRGDAMDVAPEDRKKAAADRLLKMVANNDPVEL